MKLKPLADRVILKQFKAEEKTKSGLILAASAQEKPEMFEVVEVGPGGMTNIEYPENREWKQKAFGIKRFWILYNFCP